jgi:hypothetical protein
MASRPHRKSSIQQRDTRLVALTEELGSQSNGDHAQQHAVSDHGRESGDVGVDRHAPEPAQPGHRPAAKAQSATRALATLRSDELWLRGNAG